MIERIIGAALRYRVAVVAATLLLIGGGSWGTAFARLLALSGHDTTLVCRDPEQAKAIARRRRNPRYLFDVELPASLAAAGLDDADLSQSELIALAVPSRGFAAVVARRPGVLERRVPVQHVAQRPEAAIVHVG